jgi:hypothetical protein
LRLDTVLQHTENAKGVYPINAVDEITQGEIVASGESISEAYLEPVLATMLRQFPFVIHGFNSDNGSECSSIKLKPVVKQLDDSTDEKPSAPFQ